MLQPKRKSCPVCADRDLDAGDGLAGRIDDANLCLAFAVLLDGRLRGGDDLLLALLGCPDQLARVDQGRVRRSRRRADRDPIEIQIAVFLADHGIVEKRRGDLVDARGQVDVEAVIGPFGSAHGKRLDRSAVDHQGHFRPHAAGHAAPGANDDLILSGRSHAEGLSHAAVAPEVPAAARDRTAFGVNGGLFGRDHQLGRREGRVPEQYASQDDTGCQLGHGDAPGSLH